MADARLDGSARPVQLTGTIRLTAPKLVGYARIHPPQAARVRGADLGTETLEAALKQAGWGEQATVELGVKALPGGGAGGGQDVRGPGDVEALELSVADPGPDWGVVVLSQDEAGVLSWHFPLDQANQIAPPTRGGTTQTFRIPRAVMAPPTEQGGTRGILGLLGKKLLKVLVYPVADKVLGPVSDKLAERWEAANRPYGIRTYLPGNYKEHADAPPDWQRLSEGRSLLFIHGTFSRADSAFGSTLPETMAELEQRYGGRMIAFNHPTLSASPQENVAWLLKHLPEGVNLDVDIICHSRGGLVARTLAEQYEALKQAGREVRVGRVIFVGSPNSGTILANPDHMTTMIDRYTTVLNLFALPSLNVVLEGLLLLVKLVGHGALTGLPGLASMRPGSMVINRGASPTGQSYYAITADFDPDQAGLGHLVKRAGSARQKVSAAATVTADKLIDDIFQQAANDLVVPTEGVYSENGHPNFPIPGERRFRFGPEAKVMHVNYFGQEQTEQKLLEWLVG